MIRIHTTSIQKVTFMLWVFFPIGTPMLTRSLFPVGQNTGRRLLPVPKKTWIRLRHHNLWNTFWMILSRFPIDSPKWCVQQKYPSANLGTWEVKMVKTMQFSRNSMGLSENVASPKPRHPVVYYHYIYIYPYVSPLKWHNISIYWGLLGYPKYVKTHPWHPMAGFCPSCNLAEPWRDFKGSQRTWKGGWLPKTC